MLNKLTNHISGATKTGIFGKVTRLCLILCFLVISSFVQAQEDSLSLAHAKVQAAIEKGIRFNLTPDTYLKLSFYDQVMARYIWNNPGSIGASGEEVNQTMDFLLRRNRIWIMGEVEKKLVYFIQYGANNYAISQLSNGVTGAVTPPQFFLHDWWFAWKFSKRLHLGAGLHSVNGISRMTSISSSWNIAIDAPGFNFPTGNVTDQVARQQGVFARGHLGILQYRVAFNKPFVTRPSNIAPAITQRAFDRQAETFGYHGYFSLNFKYKEDDLAFPFTRFAYLGTKKIFNIGWGFHYQPKSTESRNLTGGFDIHNKLLMGYDIFIEQPFANKGAFSLYGVWYDFRFGPHYIRSIGNANYYSGGAIKGEILPQGGGNQEFAVGSGKIGHLMLAYLLPPNWIKTQGKWQLYGTATYKDFDALADTSFQWSTGLNYYFYTRNLKLTGAYQTRPIYQGTVGPHATGKVIGSKGLLALMIQLII